MNEQEKPSAVSKTSKTTVTSKLQAEPELVVEKVETKTEKQVEAKAEVKVEEHTEVSAAKAAESVTDPESPEVQSGMVEQFRLLKQDLLQHFDSIKLQLLNSQKDLVELTQFAKAELNTIVEELTKLGSELKDDVSEISTKHKEHLTETLKRSKESGLEAWNKVKH